MILIESPSLISIFSNEEKREIADYKTARDLPTTCNASGKKRPTGFALHEMKMLARRQLLRKTGPLMVEKIRTITL